MITITATLVGTRPLIMHNGRLNDPQDEITQALDELARRAKKDKTDAIMLERDNVEWQGSLYEDDGRVGLPSDNVLMALIEGARKTKLGKAAQAGVLERDHFFFLEHDGPNDLAKLMEDRRYRLRCRVKVQRNGVMRVRPIFRSWKLPVAFDVIDDAINPKDVVRALWDAGAMVGMGDWRPRYGRFTVENVKIDGQSYEVAA